jgi:hypothetical protein
LAKYLGEVQAESSEGNFAALFILQTAFCRQHFADSILQTAFCRQFWVYLVTQFVKATKMQQRHPKLFALEAPPRSASG